MLNDFGSFMFETVRTCTTFGLVGAAMLTTPRSPDEPSETMYA